MAEPAGKVVVKDPPPPPGSVQTSGVQSAEQAGEEVAGGAADREEEDNSFYADPKDPKNGMQTDVRLVSRLSGLCPVKERTLYVGGLAEVKSFNIFCSLSWLFLPSSRMSPRQI